MAKNSSEDRFNGLRGPKGVSRDNLFTFEKAVKRSRRIGLKQRVDIEKRMQFRTSGPACHHHRRDLARSRACVHDTVLVSEHTPVHTGCALSNT